MHVPRFACLLALACAGSCVSAQTTNSTGVAKRAPVSLSNDAAPTEPVGTSSPTQTATVTITTAGTLQTISVLTQGAIGLDFNVASGGTCSVGTAYAVGNTCTVNYTFKPTRPWIRYGGIALADSSGNLLGNTYITGTGTGPQPIFPSNNSVATLGGGFSYPVGVAVDASGDVYVADYASSVIKEVVAVNGSIPANPTVRSLGSGFLHPLAVAVDGSGNVFVGDYVAVYEMVAVDGVVPAEPTIRNLGKYYDGPGGLAVDGKGNVFATDPFHNVINEMVAVNGVIPVNPTVRSLGSGFSAPDYVAVDGSGNVYVVDFGNQAIKEMLAVNGSIPTNPTIRSLGSGFVNPYGVAVDGSGNVYVTDQDPNTIDEPIKEMLAVNGSIPVDPTIRVLGSGLIFPFGVAVDENGNVYAPEHDHSQIIELTLADPPSLSFAATPVGFASSDSPQSVMLENNGNATLTGTSFTSANWDQVAGSGTPADCTARFSLGAGAECNLSISFKPTELGTLTGTATFTDNALNVPGATQEVALSGEGIVLPAPYIATINPHYGAPGSEVYITGINFGATKGSSTVTFNGVVAEECYWADTYIYAKVPANATTGNIVVTVAGKSSNAIPFSVVPTPSVSGISPTSGPVGTLVTISGQNLLDAEGHGLASLNGKYIPIVSQSNTAIQVNVPAGGTTAQFHIVVNNTVVRTPLFTVTP
jgi:streptogramin lyase